MELKENLCEFKNTPQFSNYVDGLNGSEFKVKHDNGKFKRYIMKDGTLKIGFWCPFCPFGSDRSGNLKIHVKKCDLVGPKMVSINKKTTQKIPTCSVKHELIDMDDELKNLYTSMREITSVKMCGYDREKYIGAMVWKFRNNFLPGSIFKHLHSSRLQVHEKNDTSYYNDSEFHFGIYEKNINEYTLVGINEIIPYLIINFREVFISGYKKLKQDDFAPPIWWWHKAIYGHAHPNDWQVDDKNNLDLYMLPEEGSSQWHKDQLEFINKMKPIYAHA